MGTSQHIATRNASVHCCATSDELERDGGIGKASKVQRSISFEITFKMVIQALTFWTTPLIRFKSPEMFASRLDETMKQRNQHTSRCERRELYFLEFRGQSSNEDSCLRVRSIAALRGICQAIFQYAPPERRIFSSSPKIQVCLMKPLIN